MARTKCGSSKRSSLPRRRPRPATQTDAAGQWADGRMGRPGCFFVCLFFFPRNQIDSKSSSVTLKKSFTIESKIAAHTPQHHMGFLNEKNMFTPSFVALTVKQRC